MTHQNPTWRLFLLFMISTLVTSGSNWRTYKNIRGISYAPTPRGIVPDFSPILFEKDMFNSDFQAIWGVDEREGVSSRNDLQALKDQGFNSLHLYGWNAQSEVRDHRPFLDYCQKLGINVWVPISDAFLDWANHEAIARGVVDTTRVEDGSIHPAVYGWLISNEYDLGHIPISEIVEVINIVADADPSLDRPFSVPVSTQVDYNGDSRPGIGALIELHDNLGDIFLKRFIHSINPFFPYDPIEELILKPYLQQFTDVWGIPPIPIMMGESGRSSDEVGVDEQTNEYIGMACGFLGIMESDNPYNFVGFFLFEFTQEDWKGTADQFYGLHSLTDNFSPTLPTTVKTAPGTPYEVNGLTAIPAWDDIVSILITGPKNNGLCNGRTGGAAVDSIDGLDKQDAHLIIAISSFLLALVIVGYCGLKWRTHNKEKHGDVETFVEMNQRYSVLEDEVVEPSV